MLTEPEGSIDRTLAELAELLKPEADHSGSLARVALLLDHAEEPVRLLAALVLLRIGEPAIGPLIAALAPEQPVVVRTVAALGLASIGAPASAAVRELCRCLTSPEESLRGAASVALGKIGPAAATALQVMLRFPNADAVAGAVSALALIGPPGAAAIPDLDALALRSPVPLKLSCAAALVRTSGDPKRGLPMLQRALADPDPAVRKLAVERIGELQDAAASAAPDLLRALADPVPGVRSAAALAVARARVPAPHGVPALTALLDDPEPEVRTMAASALTAFGHEAAPALPKLRALAQSSGTGPGAAANAAAAAIEKAA
jgi:HEAT repeat protein